MSRAWRIPAAPSSAVSVAWRCFSPPYTLSQTVAWARSEVVSTPVTVTNPIRGSLSVGIVSETTALIDSSTRRIRGDLDELLVIERHEVALAADQLEVLSASQRSAVSSSRSASLASRATQASVKRARCQTS